MIDFHTHLLYGIDDGVARREDSLRILAECKEAGIDHLVFTPHLYNPYVRTDVSRIRGTFADLRAEAARLGVDAYLGAELFVRGQRLKTIPVLGRYALCELDTNCEMLGFCDRIDRDLVEAQGYEIIIAHVERYTWLEPGGAKAREMKRRGYLFQMNAEAARGAGGRRAEEWLASSMIDLFATDNHGRRKGLPFELARACEEHPQIAAKMIEMEQGIQ